MVRRLHLLQLPPLVLEEILLKVAHGSYKDIVRCKNVCVAMREVIQSETFYRSVDVFTMETHWGLTRSEVDFNRACLDALNPSAIFTQGTIEFFWEGKIEEGLFLIQQAAEKGYDIALYTYCFLTRIMFPRQVFNPALVNLSRDFVLSAKKKVKASSRGAWHNVLTPKFLEKVSPLTYNDAFKKMWRCKCQEVKRDGLQWYEWPKPPPRCDSCFWTDETIAFTEVLPAKLHEFHLEYPKLRRINN